MSENAGFTSQPGNELGGEVGVFEDFRVRSEIIPDYEIDLDSIRAIYQLL